MDAALIILLVIIAVLLANALSILNNIFHKLDDLRFKLEQLDDISKDVSSISEVIESKDRERSKIRVENQL